MNNALPLLLFALSTTVTPGPNNIMLASSGANFGLRRTLPHILGITFGFPLMLIAVGLGFGNLLHTHPKIWSVMKCLGFIFLLFLAWKITTFHPGAEKAGRRSRPLTFGQAALFQWLNPKAWVLVIVAIPTYTSGEGKIVHEVLAIGCIYLIISLMATTLWTMFGTVFRHWLVSDMRRRIFNGGMAVLLIASVAFSLWAH